MPGTFRVHGLADPFAFVRIFPTFPAEITNFAVLADVDGRFELQDLFPGEYAVSVDNYRSSSGFRIKGPSQTIALTEDMELMLASPRVVPQVVPEQQ